MPTPNLRTTKGRENIVPILAPSGEMQISTLRASLVAQRLKGLPAMRET